MAEKEFSLLKNIGKATLLGVVIYEASNFAFSTKTRKQIGQRDNWTCQADGCDDGTGKPKSFQNGWMVFAGHEKTHDRGDADYDDASSGKIHCIEHEIQFHQQLLADAEASGNRQEIAHNRAALQKLSRVDHHTWDYNEHPEKYGTNVTDELTQLRMQLDIEDGARLSVLRAELDEIKRKR